MHELIGHGGFVDADVVAGAAVAEVIFGTTAIVCVVGEFGGYVKGIAEAGQAGTGLVGVDGRFQLDGSVGIDGVVLRGVEAEVIVGHLAAVGEAVASGGATFGSGGDGSL